VKRLRISTGREIRVGSFVRVLRLPPHVKAMPRETRRVFRAALGNRFKVVDIVRRPDIPRLVELHVTRVVVPAVPHQLHSIWIEPEFLG
jgi:hypothetical protein